MSAPRPPGAPTADGQPQLTSEDAATVVAVAAHELKNALGGIGVALARCELRLRTSQAVTADDLASARVELRRLSALVNDLLDGARVDLGAVPVQLARLDVVELTREVVEMFRAARAREVVLQVPPRPVLLDADADRVRAVLINYLENAVKYAPESRQLTVTVGASPVGRRARIAVTDQGPGIPPDVQPRLFERFFRVQGAAKRTDGLGLGLYLCRSFAEAHQGAAGVDSAPGAGATFWLDLPLPAATGAAGASSGPGSTVGP